VVHNSPIFIPIDLSDRYNFFKMGGA